MRADFFNHYNDLTGGDTRYREYPVIPEIGCHGFDSISENYTALGNWSWFAGLLCWLSGDSITVMVDQVLAEVNWDIGRLNNHKDSLISTAGIPNAHEDHNLVRKFSVKQGETNWRLSKGEDAASSSWMLIPHNDDLGHMPFETEGNHGNFILSYSSSVFDLNEGAGTLTVPWGTHKFDSLLKGLNLGPGIAWQYKQNTNFEDSISMICKDGDQLVLYACGNELQSETFTIIVEPPINSDKTVFAKRRIIYPDTEAEDYIPGTLSFVDRYDLPSYQVDEYMHVMDTIGYVPFATKVDTFLMLLEKPPNASWEIVFKSGEESSEVVDGDILKVTSADGSFKEYFQQYRGSMRNNGYH